MVVLVPHPSDSALMLCAPADGEHDNALVLPHLRLRPEPAIEEITQGLAELLGAPVTLLRANALRWHENFDAASMLVEVEPIALAASATQRWERVEESEIAAVVPAWARASVASWVHERTSGWSVRRPPWSRPGWMGEASAWMRAQMETVGYAEPQTPQIHHLWGVSVVLSASSRNGTAYLKCSGAHFRGEAAVTQALAHRSPGLLPDVVAVDQERGWLLMRDLGAPMLGDQPQGAWGHGLETLAALQQQWLGHTDELLALGAADRPLTALAAWVEDTAHDEQVLDGLVPDQRAAWLSQVPVMVDSCLRLTDLGPRSSLVHGDFHPWNVVSGNGGVQIFDWSDASVAHPFIDVATYIMRCPDPESRQVMMRRYLEQWFSYLPGDDLQEVGHLALVVGALHQAHTYRQLIPTVMPDDLGQLRGGDTHWLLRALRFATEGIRSTY